APSAEPAEVTPMEAVPNGTALAVVTARVKSSKSEPWIGGPSPISLLVADGRANVAPEAWPSFATVLPARLGVNDTALARRSSSSGNRVVNASLIHSITFG